MTADSIPINPDWPMNKPDDDEPVERSIYLFSAENPEIGRELTELETARGPRRMKVILRLLDRLLCMREMMETELKDSGWWEKVNPHPGLSSFLAQHLEQSQELQDMTKGFMVPTRGRPKGANIQRNVVVLSKMADLVESGSSIAQASRVVSEELAQGRLPPMPEEILEPKTIANLWTTHQKNQSLDDE